MDITYAVDLIADPDGGFIATIADLPEVITTGDTKGEALTNASDALGLALLHRLKEDGILPTPTAAKGRPEVSPDATDAAKLAVIVAFSESGMSKTALAHAMGKGETIARRILDPQQPTKLDAIEQAMRAMGKQLTIGWRDNIA